MNLLLIGPPATGKSRAAMERFRAAPGSALVAPTSTMAEHLRHELARSGYPLRPSRVMTLAQLLESWEIAPAPSRALLSMLISEALNRLRPQRFRTLAGFPALHSSIAELLEEIPLESLKLLPGDLEAILREAHASLAARGLALRNQRLRAASTKLRSGALRLPEQIVFDGFFGLSPAELQLIEALSERTRVVLTLPEFPGSEVTQRRLERAGFAVERFEQTRRHPRGTLFCAASPEREAAEIARRLLEHAGRGKRFRDMGIVLRSRETFAPLLETTLARFGIPARFYFSDPAAAHPTIAFLCGIVRAMQTGWDHAGLGALLRMPASGIGATAAGDRFDFELRDALPGAGLPIPGLSAAPPILHALARLESWKKLRLEPEAWAEKLRELLDLLPTPEIPEGDRERIEALRSTAAALKLFAEILDQSAVDLGKSGAVPLARFWNLVETALALEPLRVEDRRRDAVHVMDVFEARQWELPVVFVCGLLEREFPKYHREDPLTPDSLRARLGLPTAQERQREEQFLFDLASTRATEETVLSYSRFNEKGEETIPSFFLNGAALTGVDAIAAPARIRPAPSRKIGIPARGPVQDPELLGQIAQSHQRLSPSGVEKFLQCPFQFFAEKTLRLHQRPPAPRDRMNVLLQGTIIHAVLAEVGRWLAEGGMGPAPSGRAILDPIFDRECERARIPATYRKEAVRLELRRHFEMFLAAPRLGLDWPSRFEEKFEFPLNGAVTIRGRIDRLAVSPSGEALVIDYKYSVPGQVRDKIGESEAGHLVQGGLYLLAAERAFGLKPAGMLYCGVKKEVSWEGWHTRIPGLERIGEARTGVALRELIADAAARAARVYEAIGAGRIAVDPADPVKCRWCDYRDACRVESIAEAGAGAGG